MQINQLNVAASLSLGDLIPIFSTNNGDTQQASLNQLLTLLEANLSSGGSTVTQYASPNATGFTVNLNAISNNFLLLTPLADYAAGTLVLPATPVDQWQVRLSTTHAVTTLTVNGNGNTVNGAPTALTVNSFFTLRYDGVNKSWYRTA